MLLVGQTAGGQPPARSLATAGNGDGHRGSAAGRNHHLESGHQHRSEAGLRAARCSVGAGWISRCWRSAPARTRLTTPMLLVSDIGSGASRFNSTASRSRRSSLLRQRPAPDQPGWRCGVRVRHRPVQCHPGPIERRRGERHYEVWHQHLHRYRAPAFSVTTAAMRPIPIAGYVLPYSNQAVSAHLWRADPEGSTALLRVRTSTSASRRRSRIPLHGPTFNLDLHGTRVGHTPGMRAGLPTLGEHAPVPFA